MSATTSLALTEAQLFDIRRRGWRGGIITPHRAFARLRFTARDFCVISSLVLAITAAWLCSLRYVGELWFHVFRFWHGVLGLEGSVARAPQVWGPVHFSVPTVLISAGAPGALTWWTTAAVTLLVLWITFGRTSSIRLFTALSGHHSGHSARLFSLCRRKISPRPAQLHRRNAPFRDHFHHAATPDSGLQLLPIRLSTAAKGRTHAGHNGLSGHLSALPVHAARLDHPQFHPLYAPSILRIRPVPRRSNLRKPLFLGHELALPQRNLTLNRDLQTPVLRLIGADSRWAKPVLVAWLLGKVMLVRLLSRRRRTGSRGGPRR